jgi:hypothetical protein
MSSSTRVLNGSKTKGTTVQVVTIGEGSDSVDMARQGVYIRDYDDIVKYFSKIRSHSEDINTLNGKDLVAQWFNEEQAGVLNLSSTSRTDLQIYGSAEEQFISHSLPEVVTTPFDSTQREKIDNIFNLIKTRENSMSAVVNLAGNKPKLSSRITHRRMNLEFGQTDIYNDAHPFYDTMDHNPVTIIKKRPWELELSPALFDHSSDSAMNGVIEMFNIRTSIDRSGIDAPFYASSVWGSFGHDVDPYRRSTEILEGFNSPSTSPRPEFFSDVSNIDTYIETSMVVDSKVVTSSYALELPGAFPSYTPILNPFIDEDGDMNKFMKNHEIEAGIKNVIVSGSNKRYSGIAGSLYHSSDYTNFDFFPTSGFIYGNENSSIDSIAFGGLLK